MQTAKNNDPWTWKKYEIDPWNSPTRRKREDALMRGQHPGTDCAFDEESHHAPAFRRGKISFTRPSAPSQQDFSADDPRRLLPQLIPFAICAVLFVVVLLVSFVSTVLFGASHYEYISTAMAVWLDQFLSMLLILGALTLFFLARLKNAMKQS